MSFTPSKFQAAINAFVQTGTGNAIVKAVAGSGKTTTIVGASQLIPRTKRGLFLAFNKKIQIELASRLPKHFACQTLNSLGHQAWLGMVGRNVQLDTSKTYNILKTLKPNYEDKQFERVLSNVRKMVSIAKASGIAPKGFTCILEDTDANWEALIDHHNISFDSDAPGVDPALDQKTAIQISRACLMVSVGMKMVIDFDDQVYMTVLHGAVLPKYDWVFIDEAQDVSEIQRAMIARTMAKYTRLIAVGDPAQAIYGFRGADSQSLDNIAKQFNAVTLPLSISYRCPKAVIAVAKEFLPEIEAHENAPEGTVEELGAYETEMFKLNDMVVCRNTAPLVKLAYKLISENMPAKVEGKDLAAGLVNLVKKMNAKTILQLDEKLGQWKQREMARLKQNDPQADVSSVEDKYDVIQIFMESAGSDSIPALCSAIEALFGDEVKDCVRLSTVHKAKGLEADRVFILDAWMMPSRYAVKPWQQEQERNIQYVAVTRAKEYLGYIETPRKGDRKSQPYHPGSVEQLSRDLHPSLGDVIDETVGEKHGLYEEKDYDYDTNRDEE